MGDDEKELMWGQIRANVLLANRAAAEINDNLHHSSSIHLSDIDALAWADHGKELKEIWPIHDISNVIVVLYRLSKLLRLIIKVVDEEHKRKSPRKRISGDYEFFRDITWAQREIDSVVSQSTSKSQQQSFEL